MTPIVLDRHLKERGQARQEEIKAQIAAACRNTGLARHLLGEFDRYTHYCPR